MVTSFLVKDSTSISPSDMLFKLGIGFLFVCLMTTNCAHAQTSLYTKVGVGTYQMKQLERFQSELIQELPIPAKVVNDFPATLTYELGLTHQFSENMASGGFIGYYSTGGRSHYADYSGQLRFDHLLQAYNAGMLFTVDLSDGEDTKRIAPWFFVKLSAIYTLYDLVQYLEIGQENSSEEFYFKSLNVGLQPGFSFQIPLRYFSICPEISYDLQLPGKLFFDDRAFLLNEQGEEVKANWSGFRVGVRVARRL